MSSIEDQFEFLLRGRANDPHFPEADDGPDPVVGNLSFPLKLRSSSGMDQLITLQQCVRNTGMVYAFLPSLSFLRQLSI